MSTVFNASSQESPTRIIVIGGGASGFFTAINTAEKMKAKGQPYVITILEAGQKPLQKVFISGGGRCNVTHACFEPKLLLQYYPRGQKELPGLFARFQPKDMVSWLQRHGLNLKTEADGRMFPVENTSQAVIDCFMNAARRLNIQIRTRHRVMQIQAGEKGFQVRVKHEAFEETVLADKLVLATGYSPPGWQLAQSLGHEIIPPVPSLFPFKTAASCLDELPGVSLQRAAGKLLVKSSDGKKPQKFEAEGPFLITHMGISGPLAYRLSALGASALAEASYQAELVLDLLPDGSDDELRHQLQTSLKEEQAKKQLKNTQFHPFSQRLWLALLEASGAAMEELPQSLSQKNLNRLIELIKRLKLTITGKSPSKEEFVSCGGVALKEVDFKTMESKRCPNLYLTGEILNIDGLTGGFNFQACWSAGWTASEGIVNN